MPQRASHPARTRGYKKKERTRRQLIAAAVDVIAERGEAFSVSDVAARAGVSNGTFYNYFTDRDALIAAIVPEVVGSFAADSAIAVTDEDPAVRFASITALALTLARITPDQIRVVLRLDAAQQAMIDGEPLSHLRDDLAAGFAAGRFTVGPDDAVLDVVVGSLLMALRRIVDDDRDADYPAAIVGQLLHSLGIVDPEASAIAAQAVAAARARHSSPSCPSTGGTAS